MGRKLSDASIPFTDHAMDTDVIPLLRDIDTAPSNHKIRISDFFVTPTGGVVNVKAAPYMAKGDGIVAIGSMNSGSNIFTATTSIFTNSGIDGGKAIDVSSAGGQTKLAAIVIGRNSSTSIELSTPASFTLTGQTLVVRGRTVTDAVTTAGSATVTSVTAAFTAADVLHPITITNAGRWNKVGTVVSVTNATTAVLSFTASGNVVAKRAIFGTDDTAAIRSAYDAAISAQTNLYFPTGKYICADFDLSGSSGFDIKVALVVDGQNLTLYGDGMYASELYSIGPLGNDSTTYGTLVQIMAPAAHVTFRDLGFVGTNTYAQDPASGSGASDGILIDTVGLINDIRAERCRFDNHWLIGLHHPGIVGGDCTSTTCQSNISTSYCQANSNGADGFNMSGPAGYTSSFDKGLYNATGGNECAGGNAIIENGYYAYNRSSGLSPGGLGDPSVAFSTIVRNNIVEFNTVGMVLGSNLQGCLCEGNTARCNYAGGITAQNNFGTLSKYNVIRNNFILSNLGTGLTLNNVTFFDVESNFIRDIGLPGWSSQVDGVVLQGTCTDINIIRNNVQGHASHDYSSSNSCVFVFQDDFDADKNFGSATVTYPVHTLQGLVLVGREIDTPQIIPFASSIALNPAILGRVIKITLTGNITSFASFGAPAGQRLTIIFKQDATGGRTVNWSSFPGHMTIDGTANKTSIQEFMYETGVGDWVAVSPGITGL